MKKAWIQWRLYIAEVLLGLAMDAAPKETTEGMEIGAFVAAYCEKRLGAE